MSENWHKLVGVLSGEQQHPVGRCVSYAGDLSSAQLERLCTALSESTFRGGLRLYGMPFRFTLKRFRRSGALGHASEAQLSVMHCRRIFMYQLLQKERQEEVSWKVKRELLLAHICNLQVLPARGQSLQSQNSQPLTITTYWF